MTPEERDRLARLEVKVEGVEAWLKSIDEKQDELIDIANRGKGALRIILLLGGTLAALTAAGAWVVDHLPKGWH